jgi:hypothetical protein
MEDKKELGYETITAAVDGDKLAIQKVVEYYSDEINALSNGDEDLRQHLITKLIENIPGFKKELESK